MKRHKLIIGMEVIVLGMIASVVGIQAAGSNPPSNGVKYINNGQTTVEGALNDLYKKVGSGSSSSCLPSRTASTETLSEGGSRTYYSGSYANGWTVSCAKKTCPTCPVSDGNSISTRYNNTVGGSGSVTVSSTSNAFPYFIPEIFVYGSGQALWPSTATTNQNQDVSTSLSYSSGKVTYTMPVHRFVRAGSSANGTILGKVGVLDTSKYNEVGSGNTKSSQSFARNIDNCIVAYYSDNYVSEKVSTVGLEPSTTTHTKLLTPVTATSNSSFTVNKLVLAVNNTDSKYVTLNYKVYCLK